MNEAENEELTPEEARNERVQGIVKTAMDAALDYMESEIAPDRLKAERYYNGKVDIGEEEGRSKVVATKVRDTIRKIKPSLMRVFAATDKPVEFIAPSRQKVGEVEDITRAVHAEFAALDGYFIMHDAFDDALKKKYGVVKVWWDESEHVSHHTFENLSLDEYALLLEDPEIEIQEVEPKYAYAEPLYDVTCERTQQDGRLCIENIPPEEFFFDEDAKSETSNYIIGHKREMTVADAMDMLPHIDMDVLVGLSGVAYRDGYDDEEKQERTGYGQDDEEGRIDPAMQVIGIAEAYMRIDMEEDGNARLHRIVMGGTSCKILDVTEWDEPPFAVFTVDRVPHTLIGQSIAELLFNNQDASTAILRGVLDNVALVNNPQIDVIEEDVEDMDEVLNNEIGAIRRLKRAGAITYNAPTFVAGDTLSAMQYMDMDTEMKSGVSRAGTSLDPNALLTPATATAVQSADDANNDQTEQMARNLAQGQKRVFKLMLRELVQNASPEYMGRLKGNDYRPIDPRSWDMEMEVAINVGLGTGRDEQKQAALMYAAQRQDQIWSQFGPNNGVVGIAQMRNTIDDLLALYGVRNSDRYFRPLSPEEEAMLQQMAGQMFEQARAQGGAVDPTQGIVMGEQVKAQSRERVELMKLMQQQGFHAQDNDLERDKMLQDLAVQVAKILGQYGTTVDVERIRAAQQANNQMPMGGGQYYMPGGGF